jgi:hypothetical protein
MEFNISKCKVMHVDHRNPGYTYTMAGKKLGVSTEERGVGVMVSDNLNPVLRTARPLRLQQLH